jgi:hypothetical protein
MRLLILSIFGSVLSHSDQTNADNFTASQEPLAFSASAASIKRSYAARKVGWLYLYLQNKLLVAGFRVLFDCAQYGDVVAGLMIR